MANVAVYRCDLCQKEHRRADIFRFETIKNSYIEEGGNHLCSICEDAIKKTLDERRQSNKPKLESN